MSFSNRLYSRELYKITIYCAGLFLLLIFSPISSFAELPLTVEELLTKQNQWKIETGLVYSDQTYTDALLTTLGLRYGWSADTEFYTRVGLVGSWSRIEAIEGIKRDVSRQTKDVWLGVNYKLKNESSTFGSLVFLEAAAAENIASKGNDWVYARSWRGGATIYKTNDPVVMVGTAIVGYNRLFSNDKGERINPGEFILLNPMFYFTANNEITLGAGVSLNLRGASKTNDKTIGTATTTTKLNFSFTYAASKASTYTFSTSSDVSSYKGSDFTFNWVYKM